MYYKKDNCSVAPHVIEAQTLITRLNFSKLDKSKKYICSFSGGKDSIMLLEMALRFGFKPKVYHQQIIEGLSYNKEVFDFYERRGIQIHKVESGMVAKMQMSDILCINKVWDIKPSKINPLEKTEKLIYELEQYDFNLIGIKSNDSPNRKMVIEKWGWHQPQNKKSYPIYHLTDKQVWWYIYKYKLPVNKCYEWFGRSQDVINYEHLKPLKGKSIEDYKKFVKMFPLIEPLFWAKENGRGYFNFSPLAKDGSMYNYNQNLDKYLIFAFADFKDKWRWCKMCTEDGDQENLYLEGKYYKLVKQPMSKIDYIKPISDSSLLSSVARFQREKVEKNCMDNFFILVFESVAEKENWCANNGIDNCNVLNGMEYQIRLKNGG